MPKKTKKTVKLPRKPRRARNVPAVSKYGDFLRVLVRHKKQPGEFRKLIDAANSQEIEACAEIILNAFRGNVKLTPSLIKKISQHKRLCEELISKKTNLNRRKKILKGQVGGFLGPLIAGIAAPLLGPIVKGITKSFG